MISQFNNFSKTIDGFPLPSPLEVFDLNFGLTVSLLALAGLAVGFMLLSLICLKLMTKKLQ